MRRLFAHARAIRAQLGGATERRFVFAVLGDPFFYRRWFDYLDSGVRSGMAEAMRLELTLRPVRPYLRQQFDRNTKDRITRRHYRILDSSLGDEALRALRNDEGWRLAQIRGRSGRAYNLMLLANPSPEGEVKFLFVDAELGVPLARMWGSFGFDGARGTVLWIGALQGPSPPAGLSEISAATRDLNGLRPKLALLHAACAASLVLGADRIYAPGNRSHLSFTWARRFLGRRPKVLADLDGFWSEFGAKRTHLGDYHISLPLRRRSVEDVPSKRRKEWSRRYTKIDSIYEQVNAALHDALCAKQTPADKARQIAQRPAAILEALI
jgi:uncharacterized protein VirK/YbjX